MQKRELKQTPDYQFLWSNTHPLFFMKPNIDAYRCYTNVPFNNARDVLQVSHGNNMSCFVGVDDFRRDERDGEKLLNRDFAHRFLKEAIDQCRLHKIFYKECDAIDFNSLDRSALADYWVRLMGHYSKTASYFRASQEEPTRALVQAVLNVVSPEEVSLLLASPELDVINQEVIEWETLSSKGDFDDTKILAHLKNFPWLLQNAITYKETLVELRHRLDTAAEGSVDISEEKKRLQYKQKQLIKAYPEIKDYVDILQKLAILRTEIKSCWAATEFYAIPIVYAATRSDGILHAQVLRYYGSNEVEHFLRENVKLSDNALKERIHCTVQILENGEVQSFVGATAEKVVNTRLPGWFGNKTQIKELYGTAARPGKVQGVVHILTTNDPVATKKFRNSFSNGILVTSMTQPNVVDIVRRASAIVTDEGSMLSHAAVIAREFGIPCVVGTKVATRVLKDGDLVEVDAERGIVKILERSKNTKEK